MNEGKIEELRAAEICSMAQVSQDDTRWAIPRFAEGVRSWWFFPTWFWLVLAAVGGVAVFTDWLSPWGRVIGGISVFYAGLQYGSRISIIDYFSEGLDFGKILGVLSALGVEHSRWDEISEKGNDFIIECEVGAGEYRAGSSQGGENVR